jgi:hypothetical protein
VPRAAPPAGDAALSAQARRAARQRAADPGLVVTLFDKVPPPPPRTKWTRRVPHPVLNGHAVSLSQGAGGAGGGDTRVGAAAVPRVELPSLDDARSGARVDVVCVLRDASGPPPPLSY